MNTEMSLQSSLWLMIVVQTINAIDLPGKGPRKLPAPKVYVATFVVWSILGIIADMGMQKAAAIMGWVTVLTAMVLGPFGKVFTDFLNSVANQFSTSPSSGGGTSGTRVA